MGKKNKFCGFENLLYFLVSLGTIAYGKGKSSTLAAENAYNLQRYFYLGFHRHCSYWKKVIHPIVGGENWPRDLLGDAGLAVFPHFGHKLFITGLLWPMLRPRGKEVLCISVDMNT